MRPPFVMIVCRIDNARELPHSHAPSMPSMRRSELRRASRINKHFTTSSQSSDNTHLRLSET